MLVLSLLLGVTDALKDTLGAGILLKNRDETSFMLCLMSELGADITVEGP